MYVFVYVCMYVCMVHDFISVCKKLIFCLAGGRSDCQYVCMCVYAYAYAYEDMDLQTCM